MTTELGPRGGSHPGNRCRQDGRILAALLLPALVVGVVIGVLQAATQVNEMTLSFIPKLLVTALVLLAALQFIVLRTKVGTAMRAVSFNQQAAALVGINNDRIISFTFALGSALAAAGGILYSHNYQAIDPLMGVLPGLKAFTAAVLGGIGNLAGAVVGGVLLGLIESIGSGYIGDLTGGVLGSHYADIFAFLVLILMLTLRPSGLLGERVADRA